MLDLHRLHIIHELRRLGTVTAVADSLQYTHSAISQQLAQCERDLKVTLYERVGRRLKLTEQGEILADYAAKLIALSDEAEAAVLASTSQVRGRITVTSFQTVLSTVLPTALDQLEAKYPELEVEVLMVDVETAIDKLARREVDLILGEEYPGEMPLTDHTMHRELLTDDPMYLITPTTGPWATRDISTLADAPFAIDPEHLAVGKFVQAICLQYGYRPKVMFQTPDPFLQYHMVRTGHAVSVIAGLFLPLAQEVRVVPLPDNPSRTLYTAVLAGREHHPALAAFRAALQQASCQLSEQFARGRET